MRQSKRDRPLDLPIQSVERAAQLLGLFSVERPELSLAEITARLAVSKATAHRYAVSLRRANLLRYEPASGLYSLGPKVVELSASALAGLRIGKVAGPHLERLVARSNETAVLSIWDGEAPVVVRVDDNTDRLVRISVRIGARLPSFTSAQGKVFCAFLPEEELPRLPSGPRGEALRSEFARIRQQGLAENPNLVDGIRAIAAPVVQGDRIAGAIALVGTTAAIPPSLDSPLARSLREAAEALSAELGSAGERPPRTAERRRRVSP